MLERILIADVRKAFEATAKAGFAMLRPGEKYILEEGSPIDGKAWRLMITGGDYYQTGQGGAPLTGDRGYIGWTKREAYAKLVELEGRYSSLLVYRF